MTLSLSKADFNSVLALSYCPRSVSYTHLDVYKRQAQYAGGDPAGAVDTYTAIIDYDKKAADAYYPVSYTHLDVYKRQTIEDVDFPQS